MPYDFTRPWLNLDRVFRPSGDFRLPSKLSDQVVISYDALARLFTSGSQIRSVQFTTALGVGQTVQLLPEPGLGMIQYPIRLVILNPDAATRTIELIVDNTTSTADPWGRFDASTPLVIEQQNVGATVKANYSAISVPRGNQLKVSWLSMTGGNNSEVNYFWVDIPGELVTLDDMAHAT